MAEIVMEPNDFQEQIDGLSGKVDSVEQVKNNFDLGQIKLDSMDVYKECIDEFNATLKDFIEISKCDVNYLKQIKASWMHVDSELGTKKIFDIISDFIKK